MFATPAAPSKVTVHTVHAAQLFGLVRAAESGLDNGTKPDGLGIQAGGMLLIDGFIDAADALAVSGGNDPSGISVLLTEVVVMTDGNGNAILDGNGNPIRISGGTLRTGAGGQITVGGTQDVVLSGDVGQAYNNAGTVRVDTSGVAVTATGDVTVTGHVTARDSITVQGANISAVAGSLIKARNTGGEVPVGGTRHRLRRGGRGRQQPGGGGRADLIHLFADAIRVDGVVGIAGSPTACC